MLCRQRSFRLASTASYFLIREIQTLQFSGRENCDINQMKSVPHAAVCTVRRTRTFHPTKLIIFPRITKTVPNRPGQGRRPRLGLHLRPLDAPLAHSLSPPIHLTHPGTDTIQYCSLTWISPNSRDVPSARGRSKILVFRLISHAKGMSLLVDTSMLGS